MVILLRGAAPLPASGVERTRAPSADKCHTAPRPPPGEDTLAPTRRKFPLHTAAGLAAASQAGAASSPAPAPGGADAGAAPPGAPPAWGTSPSVGPQVTEATFEEAEKLLRVQFTPAERAQAARSWGAMMAQAPPRRRRPRAMTHDSRSPSISSRRSINASSAT